MTTKQTLVEKVKQVPDYFKSEKNAIILNLLGTAFCFLGLIHIALTGGAYVSFIPVAIGVMFFLISVASRAIDYATQKQPPFVIVGGQQRGPEYN